MTEERKPVVLPFREKQGPRRTGPDGIVRSEEAEKKLNSLFAATFNTPAGNAVLDYIESLTLRTVNGPEATDAQIRHHEGMRLLASIIIQRVNQGREGK